MWKFLPWTHEIPPKGGIPPRLGTTDLDHNFEPETLAGHPKYQKTWIVA